MVFDKDFFDKIASDALKHYDWDRETYSKLIVLSENATYMVKYKDNDENAGVLRVSGPATIRFRSWSRKLAGWVR